MSFHVFWHGEKSKGQPKTVKKRGCSMKASWILVFLLALLFSTGPLWAATDHAPLITKYEGTRTCLGCHEDSGKEVAESLHYQQQGQAKFLKDWPLDKPVGMMASY